MAYGLLALEHYMPQLIKPYPDAVTRSIDIGFSFTLVFILIFYMSIKVMGEYNRSIKELEETKQELLNINGKLTLVSETDELTGVYNRRYIMNILRTQLLPKKCKMVSIIMLDIDHFKAINDTYGHSIGVYCKNNEETLDELLENVDKCLYTSKNVGRNRITA